MLAEGHVRSKILTVALICLVLLCLAVAVRGQTVQLVAAPTFPAGMSPTSVAAADFNNDGKPDIAVTNQHGVQILLNNGIGGFTSGNSYVVGTNPQAIAVGDFDRNGIVDLAVVNQGSGTVSVLLGNDDGSFSESTADPAGTNPRFVAVADVNGDGNPDLVVVDSGAGPGTSGVSVLLGDGHGTFGTAAFFATGSVSLSAAVGDFNGDGKLDIAVVNSGSDNISILVGNGNGTFQTPTNISLDLPGISVVPTSIVGADFDSDGKLDLAVATPSHRDIAVLMGQGSATFGAPIHYALDDPNFVNNISKLAVADLNGDGVSDLVLCNLSANHITVILGHGDGTFPSASSYAAGAEPIGVAIADFNADGHSDIVAADNAVDGTVAVLLGNGDGTLQAAPVRRSGFSPTSFAVGDLNGDGIPDIVSGSLVTPAPAGTGTGVAMLGNSRGFGAFSLVLPNGTFQTPKIWSTSAISAVALGDLNGDGKLDLVETNPTPGNGNVAVLIGNGDGTFQSAVNYAVGTTPEAVAVADLNGDGKPDVIVGNRTSGNISVLLNSGNGALNTAVDYLTPNTGTPESIAIGDFNGDGKPDIGVAISGVNATSIALFLGNADGTLQPYIPIPSGFHSSAILRIVAADFDGDGKADIAVTDGSTLAVLLSSGNASFQSPVTYLVGPGAGINGILAVADFNGDGKPDLVTTSRDGLAVFINNGDGTFPTVIPYSPFTGGAVGVGDFDGDGLPDIIAADSSQDSTTTDTLALLLNTSQVPANITITSTPVTGVHVDVAFGPILNSETDCVTPCTLTFNVGDIIAIVGTDFDQPSPGVWAFFSSWSDGGESDHLVVVPATHVTYTETLGLSYTLFVTASPVSGGTVTVPFFSLRDSSGDPIVPTGTVVPISATANPGYAFTSWTGPVADASNPSTTVTMTGPVTITANFTAQTVAVPNAVGDTQAAASTAMISAGLVVGNVTNSSSATVPAGDVISQSPAAGTQVASGSPVDLVISTGPPVVPHVVSFSVLFGAESFNVSSSARVHLPWQVTGIRVVFSEPIAAGGVLSLTGAAPSGFSGLGTNTLTWSITPISIGTVSVVLSGSGTNALKDAAGNALNGGTGFAQTLNVLWGDFNDDGAVSAADMVAVNAAHSAPYNIFADMNGNGIVDVSDVQIVRARAGTHLT